MFWWLIEEGGGCLEFSEDVLCVNFLNFDFLSWLAVWSSQQRFWDGVALLDWLPLLRGVLKFSISFRLSWFWTKLCLIL